MTADTERNKSIVRHIHDEVNRGNTDVFDDFLAPGYARHCQSMPSESQEMRGSAPLKAFVEEHLAAFPDWQDKIDFILAEGDRVAYATTSTGTQSGPIGPLPATNKTVRLVSLIIHRFQAGKIAETWICWENVSLLTQLGHLPNPPGPS
jgi:steroid delta-isomerase-like uncharacterized protein